MGQNPVVWPVFVLARRSSLPNQPWSLWRDLVLQRREIKGLEEVAWDGRELVRQRD